MKCKTETVCDKNEDEENTSETYSLSLENEPTDTFKV